MNYCDVIYNYYSDIVDVIEEYEYMSPSNYLFVRNVSKLFAALEYLFLVIFQAF